MCVGECVICKHGIAKYRGENASVFTLTKSRTLKANLN